MKAEDPRTELLVLLVVSGLTLLTQTMLQTSVLALFCCLYLVLHGLYKRALQMAAASLVLMYLLFFTGRWLPVLSVLYYVFLRLMPPVMVAAVVLSNAPSRLLCAFSRLHIPRTALLVGCVVIRFFPVLAAESKSIRGGMRARGIAGRIRDVLRHPIFAYECFLVPLMVRSLKLSSELSAAAFLRGAECERARSTTHAIGFGKADVAALLYLAAACACVLLLRTVAQI
ncbi:MAG: energy-coupling factor transporter transmembrane protein EcfT [Coriobacteriales bacterium]|jgi:energy-coupling factor transport system permease protein|nr:energy-coupling factor transporter transmembrane protein EcfT [Coriobacteriales bacterium]